MTSTSSATTPPRYSPVTLERAERAAHCTPFQLTLFTTMRWQSVDLRAIAGSAGVQNGYTHQPLTDSAIEQHLLWLIEVGLLRREVDGQGLTNSFRLTPLGHLLVERWQQGDRLLTVNWRDRLANAMSRWLRLPSWLQPF